MGEEVPRNSGEKRGPRKEFGREQKEKCGLNAKVAELGRSLHHLRSRNSAIELKSSLNKI
ncbi:hypothetical protein J1N35_045171 [Gossypium stocksii]|uniref:Uncharacterized protein n=1 Tax=Gossypium stocksii TaxID=47602 RepID=A0A9D3UAM7_9ROSI|nr:hypothetical protein J1N35_045171 [Gossypium stocksii]